MIRRVLLAAALLVAGCASPTADDGGGSTRIQRTKVSTSTGGALDAEPAPPPLPAEEDPNAPCKHAWEHVRQGTHAWVDEQEGMGMVALCTPIACRKCGEVRHECTQGRIRGR